MVKVSVKMRNNSNYDVMLNASLEDAEHLLFNGVPFVRLEYENGLVFLALQDVSSIVCVNESQESCQEPASDE